MTKEKNGQTRSGNTKIGIAHANPVDIHVGQRIRQRRVSLGISQEKLGEALGLTFQQVQKYEKAINRVGASRLFDLSRVLGVDISFFFEGFGEESIDVSHIQLRKHSSAVWSVHEDRKAFSRAGSSYAGSLVDEKHSFDASFLSNKETIDLVKAYYKIDDQGIRKKILELIKAISSR